MNLYKISQDKNDNYDSYDSFIAAAESEEEARRIHPSPNTKGEWWNSTAYDYGDWVRDLECITVELIGEAKPNTIKGVILSSFNAG